jgi:2-polyprenyl-3-methyl-5-hydroxy-6-metoxy-1,4-benzoquinol methylase
MLQPGMGLGTRLACGYAVDVPDRSACDCGCANVFSSREADNDLKRYRRQGADASTQALIDAIVAEGVDGATLLDIGAGIGAIQLGLLPAGLARAESVDVTDAYVVVARDEAERQGFGDRVSGRVADFVAVASEVAPADVVTLDKVLCCYPDMPALLGRAADHARRLVGLVYPRQTWWTRAAARALAVWGWLTRDPTRWYLHRTADVDALFREAGFERRDIRRELIWQVVLYAREPLTVQRPATVEVSPPRLGKRRGSAGSGPQTD